MKSKGLSWKENKPQTHTGRSRICPRVWGARVTWSAAKHLSWNGTLISQVNIPERCQNGSEFDSAQRTRSRTSLDPSSKRRSGKSDARPEDRISRGDASRCSRFRSRPAAARVRIYWQIFKITGLGLTFTLAWINGAFVFVWIWDLSSTCSAASCWKQRRDAVCDRRDIPGEL